MSQLAHHFLTHRSVTNTLVEKIEKSSYDYKPTETSMSAKTLVEHMYTSYYGFMKAVKEGNASPITEKVENTYETLIEFGKDLTDKTVELLDSLTEDELNRELDTTHIFGAKVTGHALVYMALEHEINHKGNLFVYLRLMGHTDLPLYVNPKA